MVRRAASGSLAALIAVGCTQTAVVATASPSRTPSEISRARPARIFAEKLGSLTGLGIGPDGTIYVSSFGEQQIKRLDRQGATISSWGRGGGGPGEFAFPAGGAGGPGGDVAVGGYGNGRGQR